MSRVYGFFAFRLRPGPDAEDLTAVTFERAMRHAERYDPQRASVQTWLLSIAQNALIDHYRHRGRRPETLVGHEELAELPVHDDHVLGLDPALEAALGELRERDRQIVALRYGADLSGQEIAALTGLSEANVHQVLSRSLRRLRAAMPPR